MNKLTKSQESELKYLWEDGQSVAWLDMLRKYASDEEAIIDIRHWKGLDPKTKVKTVTAGMLRVLLETIRRRWKFSTEN